MAEINVTSSWSCDNLTSCFTLGPKESPSLMDDIVQVDKCICLTSAEDSSVNPCTIEISAAKNIAIGFKMIHVVSQCRLIELFGYNGEYIQTFRGELFDEYDGTCVYDTQILLQSPLSNISLKFTRLKENEFWIYGIYITKVNLKTKLLAAKSLPQFMNQPTGTVVPKDTTSSPTLGLGQLGLLHTSQNLRHEDLPLLLAKFLGGPSIPEGELKSTNASKEENSFSERQRENLDVEKIFEELQRLEIKILDHVNVRFEFLEKKQDLILNKLDMLLNNRELAHNSNSTHGQCDSLSCTLENLEPEHSIEDAKVTVDSL